MITPEQEVELQEIAARMVAGTASPEEQATFLKLSELKKKAVAERADKIEKFVLAIQQHGVHFNELAEAFDKEQIAGWAQANGLMKHEAATRKPRTTNKEPALIQFELVNGGKFPAAYRLNQRGQLNEKFVTLYLENPDKYEKALRVYFTEEGRKFFATKDGETHLASLIKKIKAKAEKVSSGEKKSTPAKKTAAAKKTATK